MPFTLDPDIFEKKDAQGNARVLSERTKKDYTGKLNSLAKAGWGDRAALKKNYKDVIEHIKALYPEDTEMTRHKKRFILYAIFWAMDAAYIAKGNPYHRYLKKIPPMVNVSTGEAWVPLKEYREKADSD
jgi:hypothetical protein